MRRSRICFARNDVQLTVSSVHSLGRSYGTTWSRSRNLLQQVPAPPVDGTPANGSEPPTIISTSPPPSSISSSSPLESVPLAVILAVQPYTTLVGPGLQIYFQYQPQRFPFQRIPYVPLPSLPTSSSHSSASETSYIATRSGSEVCPRSPHQQGDSRASLPSPLPFGSLSSALSALYAHRCLASLAAFSTSTLREVRHSAVRQKTAPLPDFWKRVGVLDTFYGTNYFYQDSLERSGGPGSAGGPEYSDGLRSHHPATAAVELCRGSHRQELDVRITLYEEEPPAPQHEDALSLTNSMKPAGVASRHPRYRPLSSVLLTGPSGIVAVEKHRDDRYSGQLHTSPGSTTSFSDFMAQQRQRYVPQQPQKSTRERSDDAPKNRLDTSVDEGDDLHSEKKGKREPRHANKSKPGEALDWLVGQKNSWMRDSTRTLRGGLYPACKGQSCGLGQAHADGNAARGADNQYIVALPHLAGFKASALFYYDDGVDSRCGEPPSTAVERNSDGEVGSEEQQSVGYVDGVDTDEKELEEVLPPWTLLPLLTEVCNALGREGHISTVHGTSQVSGMRWWMCAYQYSYFQDVVVGEQVEVVCAPPRYFPSYRVPPWKTRIGAPPSIGITRCVALRGEVRQHNEVALAGTFFFYPINK